MIPAPSLPWFELARFKRSRLTRLALVAVCLVPLLYGALYVIANWNPTGHVDKLSAAVVNDDKIVSVGSGSSKQTIALGRLLAGQLTSSASGSNYDWHLTSASDAKKGLADGSYSAVLTIPKSFSSDAASTSSNDASKAVQGQLDLRTNDAQNYINGNIAKAVGDAATTALNGQVTRTYLDNIYLGFNGIHTSIAKAADGAATLADGAEQLAAGAGTVDSGAQQLASGSAQLASGTQQLNSKVGELASKTPELAAGAKSLASGSRTLESGATQVAGGTQQVADVVDGLGAVADTAAQRAQAVVQAAPQAAAQLRQLADQCDATAQPAVCQGLSQAATAAEQLAGNTAGLSAGITQLHSQVTKGVQQVDTLNAGAHEVAKGASRLSSGASQVSDGVSQLNSGAQQLHSATGTLAAKTGELSSGASQLASGTGRLASGADDLASGAQSLSSGLADGEKQVPTYDKDARDRLGKVAATPTLADIGRDHDVKNYGSALAPYFASLALWVGALAIFLLLRPLSPRSLMATTPSWRVATSGFFPGAVLSTVQSLLLVGVLTLAIGIHPASPGWFVGIALLAGWTFIAINQVLVAWFGTAGRFLALVFVCLQLTAAGGTYPIDTSPAFFQVLHPLLPMTYAVEGLRTSIAGGGQGLGTDVFALVLWGVGAFALTVLGAHRQRVVTPDRLHPVLA